MQQKKFRGWRRRGQRKRRGKRRRRSQRLEAPGAAGWKAGQGEEPVKPGGHPWGWRCLWGKNEWWMKKSQKSLEKT